MLNKELIKVLKEIAKIMAISLFFTSFLIFIISIPLKNKIDTAINLINKIIIVEKNVEKKDTIIDNQTHRLKNYPRYGEIYATINIPSINKQLPLYHGDSLKILKYGIGHYAGSYFPGEGGTILVAGHNSEKYLRHINELVSGDKIIINANYGNFTYKIVTGKVMHKKELEKLEINDNKEILVMYTCYPPTAIGLTDKRYVITAELVGESYE